MDTNVQLASLGLRLRVSKIRWCLLQSACPGTVSESKSLSVGETDMQSKAFIISGTLLYASQRYSAVH